MNSNLPSFSEHALPNWRRGVLKVGSSLLAAEGEGLNPRHALGLAQFVAASQAAGREVVIVSSAQWRRDRYPRQAQLPAPRWRSARH